MEVCPRDTGRQQKAQETNEWQAAALCSAHNRQAVLMCVNVRILDHTQSRCLMKYNHLVITGFYEANFPPIEEASHCVSV